MRLGFYSVFLRFFFFMSLWVDVDILRKSFVFVTSALNVIGPQVFGLVLNVTHKWWLAVCSTQRKNIFRDFYWFILVICMVTVWRNACGVWSVQVFVRMWNETEWNPNHYFSFVTNATNCFRTTEHQTFTGFILI